MADFIAKSGDTITGNLTVDGKVDININGKITFSSGIKPSYILADTYLAI